MAEEQTQQTEQGTTQQAETSLANTNQQTEQTTQKTEPEKTLANEVEKTEAVKAVVPEKYEFKPPEGFEFNQESLDRAVPIFKKLGLDQAGAQELMDLYAAEAQKVANGPVEYWQQMQTDWRKEITSDPKYGNGNGGLKPEVTKAIADVKNLLPPEIKGSFEEAMELTGAGNNPAFIKTIHFLASKLTEGAHVSGGGPAKQGQAKPGAPSGPGAASLWPNLPSASGQ